MPTASTDTTTPQKSAKVYSDNFCRYIKLAITTHSKILAGFVTMMFCLCVGTAAQASIQDEVIYFVLPDRFANGDPQNDYAFTSGTRGDHGFDAESASYYHGGDFAGLTRKLGYIKRLGATAIWITPPFKNDPSFAGTGGYHGYWILDYTAPDPHLGTKRELKHLIRSAHARGLKVYFDIVLNHTADVIKYEECHDQVTGEYLPGISNCDYRSVEVSENNPYTPFVLAGKENIKAPAFLNDFSNYHNQGNSTFSGESSIKGDFDRLDDLNSTKPEVINGMIDVFKMWIKEYRIDGYRLDTVKHVDMEFWKQWTPAIRAYAKEQGRREFHIFGEVFDGNPRGVSAFTKAAIPTALDFPLYYPTRRVFSGESAPSDLLFVYDRDDLYTDADTSANDLLAFVSNHDVGRIGHYINQNLPDASNEEKMQRVILAHAFMFFGRGVPVIYYGDEQGFVGDGEGEKSREDMMPSLVAEYNDNELLGTNATTADDNFDWRHPIFQRISDFSRLYSRIKALRSGSQTLRYAETEGPGILAFSRIAERGREYLVVFNTSTEEKSITLPATSTRYRALEAGRSLRADDAGMVDISLPGLSFEIFRAQIPAEIFTEDYALSLSVPTSVNGLVNGEITLRAQVSNESQSPLPQNTVSFEIKIGDDGEYQYLGTDNVAPYRVYYDTSSIANGTPISIRATTFSPDGNAATDEKLFRVDTIEGMEIRFKKPSHWAKPYIYYYDTTAALPVWPGILMRDHGDDWYSYKFPEGTQSATIIFHDGTSSNRYENLTRNGSACFVEGEWIDSCDLPFTVYSKKPAEWKAPLYIHFWEAGPSGGTSWPGEVMNSLGGGWYSYTFAAGTESANMVIHDFSGNQSDNLQRNSTGCYHLDDRSWSDECDRSSAPYGDTNLYLRGDMNGWSTDNVFTYQNDGTYSTTLSLNAGTYNFKVADAAWSSGTNFGSHFDDGSGEVDFANDKRLQDASQTNLSITILLDGAYEFVLDTAENAQGSLLTEPLLRVRPN